MKRHRSDRLDVVCAPRESRARRALRFAWCLALLGCLQLTWDAPLAFCALRAGRYVQQPLALKGESAAFGRRAVIPAVFLATVPYTSALAEGPSGQAWLQMAPRELLARSESSLADTIRDWEKIVVGGGDAVRRALGTVGATSPLYALRKAMRALVGDARKR
mmetsp:Transcript_40352/g.81397  ORF Transcript_40352/g.81397 Transcript_40352/m.81397 type:complete len:162 (-) Transcript_40352:297-782(-)